MLSFVALISSVGMKHNSLDEKMYGNPVHEPLDHPDSQSTKYDEKSA